MLLLADAWVAADPASLAEFVTCASAYVSGTVTSQASGLPLVIIILIINCRVI